LGRVLCLLLMGMMGRSVCVGLSPTKANGLDSNLGATSELILSRKDCLMAGMTLHEGVGQSAAVPPPFSISIKSFVGKVMIYWVFW
jgi:hypothetical protein